MALAPEPITITLKVDLTPAVAAIDAFIASLTEMRDRLEVEIEHLTEA